MAIAHIALVLDAGGLNASEKILLTGYCNHTDAHGYTWAGAQRLSDETGMSERTVQRTNELLRDRGLIKSVRRFNPKTGKQITNLTRVNLELLATMKRPPRNYGDNLIEEITFDEAEAANLQVVEGRQSDTPRGDNLSPSPRQSDTPRGDNLSPKSSVEPSVDPSSHPPRPRAEQTLLDAGATEDEMTRAIEIINNTHRPRNLSAYVATMARNGDLAALLAELRKPQAQARPAAPDKCDDCNPFRRLEDAEGNDIGACPKCHPGAGQEQHRTLRIHGERPHTQAEVYSAFDSSDAWHPDTARSGVA